jgi:hypothetical protein
MTLAALAAGAIAAVRLRAANAARNMLRSEIDCPKIAMICLV